MDTQYVSRKHRTTASLAAELRHIAQMLDDWDNAPIEPTLLCVDMLVESEDEVARATVERLHHLVFTNPPVYSRASGHYGTSFEDATSGRHTWIKVYGKMPPPAHVIAEAWDAAHAEQVARTDDSVAGGENTRIPPAVAVTDAMLTGDECAVAATRRMERGAFLASAMLDPDATLQIPAVVDYRTVTP